MTSASIYLLLQVCQYYYALQIYSNLHPWTKPTKAPLYLHDPAVVIACASLIALKYRQQCQQSQSCNKLEADGVKFFTGNSKIDENLLQFYEYFASSESVLDDYVQGEALHRLDAGVDTVRFLNDPSYKEDTVLGLCMTTDQDMLDLALVLARKYDVSLWDVHMTQIQYMFSSDLTTHQISSHIKSRKAMEQLKSNPKLFIDNLKEKVLTLIDGTDHGRLVLFYSLIAEVAANSASSAEEEMAAEAQKHVDFLKELTKVAPSLNYHYLIRKQTDTMQHLG